jgi:F1F0 ATPase subunit 2
MEFFLFLLFGAFLGLLFFGGLWITVRSLPRLKHPQAAFWSGSMIRFTCCLFGFSLALSRSPLALAAACGGFYIVRMGLLPIIGQVRSGQREVRRPCR